MVTELQGCKVASWQRYFAALQLCRLLKYH